MRIVSRFASPTSGTTIPGIGFARTETRTGSSKKPASCAGESQALTTYPSRQAIESTTGRSEDARTIILVSRNSAFNPSSPRERSARRRAGVFFVRSATHAVSASSMEQHVNSTAKGESSMKRKRIMTIATAVLAFVVTAVYAQQKFDKYSLKSPGGIAFADFRGYEDWTVVS